MTKSGPLLFGIVCSLTCSLLLAAGSDASPVSPADEGTTPAQPTSPSPPAADEESSRFPLSATWSLTVASRYLFQGVDYSDGKSVLNPEVGVTLGPLSAKLWGNHDLDQNVSDEHDFSVLRDWSLGDVALTTGYTYLWYPHREGWEPSQELYVDLSREGILNPTLSVHYDFDSGKGTYSTIGISHALERSIGTFAVGANLFYQGGYYDMRGIPSLEFNANASRSLGTFSLTPSVSRFVTWENGDFRGESAVRSAWVLSFQVSQDL